MNELIRKLNKNPRLKEQTANKAAKKRGRMHTKKKVSLLPRQNVKSGGQGFFVQGYWSPKQKHNEKANRTRVQALGNSHTLLDLLRARTGSGEDALSLESACVLSDRRPGQEEARWAPEQLEQRWANRQAVLGAEHTILEVLEPLGSEEPEETSLCPQTEGPATWKLKSWTLMLDQSTKLVAAAKRDWETDVEFGESAVGIGWGPSNDAESTMREPTWRLRTPPSTLLCPQCDA